MVACSGQAYALMKQLEKEWKQSQPDTEIICIVKCSTLPEISSEKSLTEYVGEWFDKVDAIVFISAAGIAVRCIAPYLKHKSKDPAVVVMDETGKFCISLLSGHAGGANELAERIADLSGALPVITTATDREHKFAVDVFAKKNGLLITDWEMAKKISVQILAGKRIGFCSDMPIEGSVPAEIAMEEPAQTGIWVSYKAFSSYLYEETLQLVPRSITIGIGCRKDTPEGKIEKAVERCLEEQNIRFQAVERMASIDLKKEEKGILSYCERKGIPFVTYPAGRLKEIEGSISESAFVEQTTGVPNVCERSALAASEGSLLCGKKIYDGVTIALAEKKGSVKF